MSIFFKTENGKSPEKIDDLEVKEEKHEEKNNTEVREEKEVTHEKKDDKSRSASPARYVLMILFATKDVN